LGTRKRVKKLADGEKKGEGGKNLGRGVRGGIKYVGELGGRYGFLEKVGLK